MTFTVDDLLLTPRRLEQITAALANLTVPVPLENICTEAVAEVDRFTHGYVIEDDAKKGWVRILALYKAFSLVGPAPDDLQRQYDSAIEELQAIAKGERKNLPTEDDDEGGTPGSGNWGSKDKFEV